MTVARLRPEHESWMMMSGLLALCALLAVGLFVLPAFGPPVAGITAGVVVLAIVLVCYLICVASVGPGRPGQHTGSPHG